MHEQKPSKCRMYWKGILVKIKVGCSREKKQSVNRTGSCTLPPPLPSTAPHRQPLPHAL